MGKQHIITRVLLANWWSYHNTIFDMSKGLIYFVGHNGSGKTTFLDAMSLILYGEDTNKLNYTSPDKRPASSSVHWGTGSDARRPGRTYSYIIIEARDTNDRTYYQGIRYMSKAGSENIDEKVFFWGEGTLESIRANDPIITDRGEVLIDRNNRTSDKKSAFKAFFERRGYLESFCRTTINKKPPHIRFREYCRSILNNEKINEASFSEYIKTSIFPPTTTGDEYRELSDTISKLDEMKVIDSENRRKLRFLSTVYEKGLTYVGLAEQYAFEARMAPYINVRYYTQEVERLRGLVAENEAEIRVLNDDIETLDSERDQIIREKTIIETTEDEEKRALDARERARYVFNEKKSLYERHRKYADAAGTFMEAIPELGEPGEVFSAEDVIESAAGYISDKEKELDLISRQIGDAEHKMRELDGNINALRGHTSGADATSATAQMKADADALKAYIAKKVPESAPKILYECISDVLDEEWQDAAEGLIGNNRFGIIVAPEYYDEACIWQHRFSGNTRDVIVLNTKMPRRNVLPGSVPCLFKYSSEYAELFIGSSYGAYILCGSDDEYVRNSYALRKNGQHKTPRSSVKPGSRKAVVRMFGSEAVMRQIGTWEKEKESYAQERNKLQMHRNSRKLVLDLLKKEYNNLLENKAYADGSAEKEYKSAEAALQDAEKAYLEAVESDQAKIKAERLGKLDGRLQEIRVENDKKTEAMNNATAKKNGYVAEEGNASRFLTSFTQSAESFPEPMEEDWDKAEREGILVSLRGYVNANTRKSLLEEKLKSAKESVTGAFSDNPEMLDKFVGFPEAIRDRRDLAVVEGNLENVKNVVLSDQSKKNLERLQRAVQQNYCICLQRVYQEYSKAQELRSGINSILSRYQIGQYFYRLGPINDMADPDADILGLAKMQTCDGIQLNEKQIDALNAVCRKAFDAGWNPFDYRRYITTDLQCRDDASSGWKNADRTSKNSSNGQQGILRYLFKILVLYSQAFNEEKSLNFIMTDEALQGIDDTNSRYFFDILKELGVQCLISSFEDRFAEYAELTYICENRNGYIMTHIFDAGKQDSKES